MTNKIQAVKLKLGENLYAYDEATGNVYNWDAYQMGNPRLEGVLKNEGDKMIFEPL